MFDTLNGLLSRFGQYLQNALPLSPFAPFFSEWAAGTYPTLAKGLRWLNWLFPVRAAMQLTAAWLTCVIAYFLLSLIMRWLKVIA